MTTDPSLGVGERLKKLRENKGISQYGLADASGESRDTIAKIETRCSQHPRPTTISALARHVGSTYEFLMFGIVDAAKMTVEFRDFMIRYNRLSKLKRKTVLDAANAVMDEL